MRNDHRYCVCDPGAIQWGTRAALWKQVQWPRGSVITIKFIGGDPVLHQRIKSVAFEWFALARSLRFVFVSSGSADIRIAFQQGNGSWSYLGTTCRKIPLERATLNFGWLRPDSPDSELRQVVLHEFGHALGLIHEHQNPKAGIRWNRDAVIKTLSGHPHYWTIEKIEHNVLANSTLSKGSDLTAIETDPKSIMMYVIPSDWTEDGFSTQLNTNLSPDDVAFIQSVYG